MAVLPRLRARADGNLYSSVSHTHKGSICVEAHSCSTLLPRELFSETKMSLALLFPRINTDCTVLLRNESRNLDENLTRLERASRHVQEYGYWRDNLLTIWEVFHRSQPSTVLQWWYDRRNIVQWWTFWVAFVVLTLTIVFGLISSVASIVQAWASVKSLHQS